MPTFEYTCKVCESEFEEHLVLQDEIRDYKDWFPCPGCGGRAERLLMSVTNFNFKAPVGQTAGSGVHGQSGVHDLDYPKVDVAVGRSASKKWERYGERKKARDKVRRESGNNSITQIGDKIVPLAPSAAVVRDGGMGTFTTLKRIRKEKKKATK